MAKYKEPVYWHIRRLVFTHDDAQDAAQEAFVRMFRSFSQFKGESSLCAWIYRIATNEALRILERRRNGQLSLDDPEAGVNTLLSDEYVDYSDLEAVKLQKPSCHCPPSSNWLSTCATMMSWVMTKLPPSQAPLPPT